MSRFSWKQAALLTQKDAVLHAVILGSIKSLNTLIPFNVHCSIYCQLSDKIISTKTLQFELLKPTNSEEVYKNYINNPIIQQN